MISQLHFKIQFPCADNP